MPRTLFVSTFSLLALSITIGCSNESSPSSPADGGTAGSAPAGAGGSPGGAGGPLYGGSAGSPGPRNQGGGPATGQGGSPTGQGGSPTGQGGNPPVGQGGKSHCVNPGGGGAVAFTTSVPPQGEACPVEDLEICTPASSSLSPATRSRCENGHWKTIESPATCPGDAPLDCTFSCVGSPCSTVAYCGGYELTCDGTKWHAPPATVACTPEEEGSGGAPAYRPAPPPDDRACVVEGFELCTPGTEESSGQEATPQTLSRCENGKWKTLEAPSTCQPGVFPSCIRAASLTTGKATIHDDVCCTTPGYCDTLKATCDGTRWHMDPGYTEPPL